MSQGKIGGFGDRKILTRAWHDGKMKVNPPQGSSGLKARHGGLGKSISRVKACPPVIPRPTFIFKTPWNF
ncbi:MAG: hypothetical protein QXT73_07635, partial [Candidatus Methanomethylicaceae archaeon]